MRRRSTAAVLIAVAAVVVSGLWNAQRVTAQTSVTERVLVVDARIVQLRPRIVPVTDENPAAQNATSAQSGAQDADPEGPGEPDADGAAAGGDVAGDTQAAAPAGDTTGGEAQAGQRRAPVTRTEVALDSDVLFGYDSATLSPRSRRVLTRVAGRLRRENATRVTIVGHTDARGTAAYNRRLSRDRAAVVERFLATRPGLSDVDFSSRGVGFTQPAAPNTTIDGSDNPAGRALNRRVTISFVSAGR